MKKEPIQYICTYCGRQGKSTRIMKGSFLIEVILWFFFLVPGIIYSAWRFASQYRGCSYCKRDSLVQIDSPIGIKLLKELQINLELKTE